MELYAHAQKDMQHTYSVCDYLLNQVNLSADVDLEYIQI